jgi:hypothetical protein
MHGKIRVAFYLIPLPPSREAGEGGNTQISNYIAIHLGGEPAPLRRGVGERLISGKRKPVLHFFAIFILNLCELCD